MKRPVDHGFRMAIPSPEQRLAEMREIARQGMAIAAEKRDVGGCFIELLMAVAREHVPGASPDEVGRLHALAASAFDQHKTQTPGPESAKRMVAALLQFIEMDRQKVGY